MKKILIAALAGMFAVPLSADAREAVSSGRMDEGAVLKNVNDGWAWMMSTWHPKTGLIYGCPPEKVEPAKNFKDGLLMWPDGKVRFGRGIGDCAISSGVALSMLCDKYTVTEDAAVKEDAKKVAFGLLNLARSHGRKGFVARGLCAEDGKSISRISSRDQVTHWVHGLLRYCQQPWVDEQTKADYKKLVVEVAEYMLKNVTPENEYNFLMADGKIDPRGICIMWGDKIYPHEAARLPMIYFAAWYMSGDKKWKDLYEEYIDEALDKTLAIKDKPMKAWEGRMPTYSLFQLNTSLEVILSIEKDPARVARVKDAMAYTAKMADSRLVNLLTKKRKSYYGLCVPGELTLTILMSPDTKFTADDSVYLMQSLEKPLAGSGAFNATHMTAAYWRARVKGAL